jgi:hypothetical protein
VVLVFEIRASCLLAGALPLEPCPQLFALVICQIGWVFFFFFKLGLAWILILLLMPLHGWMAEVCHRAQLSSVEMVFSLTFCLGYPQTTILMSAS